MYRRNGRYGCGDRSCASCNTLSDEAAAFELAPDFAGAFLDRFGIRTNHDIGRKRGLIGIRDAGKLPDFPGDGLLVQTFHIALGEHFERSVDEHLDEIRNPALHLLAGGAVRRNGGDHGDDAVAGEELRDKTDTADVGVAVFPAEAEALREV